jgi:molybdopterin converting factor small subunit
MKVSLLLFGKLQDIAGANRIEWQASSLSQLQSEVVGRWPAIAQQQVLWSVNQRVAKGDTPLNEGDEVALMPPFAGG